MTYDVLSLMVTWSGIMCGVGGEPRSGRLGPLVFVYQHVAAVMGAFALAALLGQLIDTEWRSVLADIIGYWETHMRPVVKTVLDALVVTPLSWIFGWFEIPVWIQDYCTAGLILTLSLIRLDRRGARRPSDLRWLVVVGLFVFLVWPLAVILFAGIFVSELSGRSRLSTTTAEKLDYLFVLAPFGYLALLYAANALLPR